MPVAAIAFKVAGMIAYPANDAVGAL